MPKFLLLNTNILRWGLITALLASIAFNLASLTWIIIPSAESREINPVIFTGVKTSDDFETTDLSNINKLNLFGVSESIQTKISSNEIKQISAPETSLNLTLRGLRKGQGSIKSSAIIEDERRVQKIYFVGDKVSGQNNVSIHEIHSQHLILLRAGKFEKLTLFEVLEKTKKTQNNNQPLKQEQPAVESIRRTPVIDKSSNAKLSERLAKIADTLSTNPLSLNGTMIIEPSEENGDFQGYKVSPGNDKVLFASLGLVKGDVVTQINDVQLNSSGKILSLMDELSKQNDMEISVLRRGQPLTFRYKIR